MIFDEYQVDFSEYVKDLQALARQRLLYQFKNSALLKAVLGAFVEGWQELYDTTLQLMQLRTVYGGYNYYLEAIGRIVGQFRENLSILADVWFTPDTDDLCCDVGLAYVTGGFYVIGGTVPDDFYRLEILARIFSNMNQYSSVPELQNAISKLFDGLKASFVNLSGEPMAVDIYVSRILTNFEQGFFSLLHQNLAVEGSYYLAWPSTLRVNSIVMQHG